MYVTSNATLTAIEKEYNLEFDKQFKYYIGNAYNDSKGNPLPSYFYLNGRIYKLQYFDGCFNPFLVGLDVKNFGMIFKEKSRKVEFVVEASTQRAIKHYTEKFGDRFTLC